MTVRSLLLVTAISAVLAGCGFYRWQKPGASNDDFKADQAGCTQPGSNTTAAFQACMQQRGWTYED